jgi:putative salt-induced outer membrane protein
MLKYASCLVAAPLLFGATAFAQDEDTNWSGSIEFSAANATGNTENTNLGLGAKAEKKTGRYTHNLSGGANFAETDGAESQNNWFVAYQLDAQLRDRTYAYGRISYEQDEFSGFENRLFLGAGLGHYIFQSDEKNWKVEGGPGYRLSKIEEPVPLPADFEDEESEFALYASSDFDLTIREGVLFEHDLSSTWTDSNTTVTTTFGLSTKLTESLSSKVSYQVDYETDPPLGREDTDTLLKASLLFGF